MLTKAQATKFGTLINNEVITRKEVREQRRALIVDAIEHAIGYANDKGKPMSDNKFKSYVRENLAHDLSLVIDAQPKKFPAGWNFDSDKNAATDNTVPFYVSPKDRAVVFSGSFKTELINALAHVTGTDNRDKAIKAWVKSPDFSRAKPVAPSSNLPKWQKELRKQNPVFETVKEFGLTAAQTKQLIASMREEAKRLAA